MSLLSAVFMYAAARQNAHFFLESDGNLEHRQQVLDFYCEQHRNMFRECMNELAGA